MQTSILQTVKIHTWRNVYGCINENDVKMRPLLTEAITATWAISYKFNELDLAIDYTGNLYVNDTAFVKY
jgi:hypothetical protein